MTNHPSSGNMTWLAGVPAIRCVFRVSLDGVLKTSDETLLIEWETTL